MKITIWQHFWKFVHHCPNLALDLNLGTTFLCCIYAQLGFFSITCDLFTSLSTQSIEYKMTQGVQNLSNIVMKLKLHGLAIWTAYYLYFFKEHGCWYHFGCSYTVSCILGLISVNYMLSWWD